MLDKVTQFEHAINTFIFLKMPVSQSAVNETKRFVLNGCGGCLNW